MTKNEKNKRSSGTLEWAEKNINFITGCIHDCKYCYSKEMAIRFKRATIESWSTEIIREGALKKSFKKIEGRLMFPSSHDITPNYINESLFILNKLLESGNDVLIVTKPHFECIEAICSEFESYKSQILFRFTIGSANNSTLKFWEPNAPSFDERLKCLKYVFSKGYMTSVSCEPMLDTKVSSVIDAITPFITDTIWIGKANNLMARLKINGNLDKETIDKAELLYNWQIDRRNIFELYKKYENNPKIRWKDSIAKTIKEINSDT